MVKIINVVGARPNFMKIAPIVSEMEKFPNDIKPILVHTGQHYDENMSESFFRDLELPRPDISLGVGSGSHAEQTAKIMIEFEKILLKEKPNLVVVVGDVNSTVACALTSVKLHIPVAHVEAGLRSLDRKMPEEINRVLTDAISDYLFITERGAEDNLIKEGRPKDKIYFVGNVMIDTLLKHKAKANASPILESLGLQQKKYALLTLHRPENVDVKDKLENIISALLEVKKHIPIVFPIHPRTRKKLEEFNLTHNNGFITTEPMGYLDFLKLMCESKFVLTDSGGIQEETTILGIPCLTLRNNTERPITVSEGTNTVVGTDKNRIITESLNIISSCPIKGKVPDLWDGHAAKRIVDTILKALTQ